MSSTHTPASRPRGFGPTPAEVMRAVTIGADRLRRRWVLILVITLLAGAVGFGLSVLAGSSYTGRAALTLQTVEGSSRRAPDKNAVLVEGYADYFNQATTQEQYRQRVQAPDDVTVSARLGSAGAVLYIEAVGDNPIVAQDIARKMASALRDDVAANLGADTLADLRQERIQTQARVDATPRSDPARTGLERTVSALDRQIALARTNAAAGQFQTFDSGDGVTANAPHYARNVGAGLAGGLALGLLLALLLGQGENRIVANEIGRTLGLTTLATIGGPRRRGTATREKRSRELLPILTLVGTRELPTPAVLAVTSVGPVGLKSGIADLLAVLRSEQGERALLVQADTSRTDLPANLSRRSGITDALDGSASSGASSRDEARLEHHVVDNGRGLLVAGPGTRRGSVAAFGRACLTTVLGQARRMSGLVVVDAPATLAAPEAEIVCSVADAAVIVLEEGRTLTSDATAAVEALRRAHVNLVGAVLVRRRTESADPGVLGSQNWQPLEAGAVAGR